MLLKSIQYAQFENTPRLWKLQDFTLGNINLIVGKNASGKTRTLNVINGLANLLSGERKLQYISGNYTVEFDHKGQEVEYILHYENKSIICEQLNIDHENKLNRKKMEKGRYIMHV